MSEAKHTAIAHIPFQTIKDRFAAIQQHVVLRLADTDKGPTYKLSQSDWSWLRGDMAELISRVEEQCNSHSAAVALAEAVRDWYENAGNSDPTQDSTGSVDLWHLARAFLEAQRGGGA